MRTGAEVLSRSLPPGSPSRAAAERLTSLAAGTGHVVNNLLLSARIDRLDLPIRREPVRLDRLAADCEQTSGQVVAEISEPVSCLGDEALLRHALTNLVFNALRHARDGGRLPVITVRAAMDEGRPTIGVQDDGPGFPPGVDALERYVTGSRDGTGLGLPLVRWIADQHRAELTVGNHGPAGGAMIELRFPPFQPVSRRQRHEDGTRRPAGSLLPSRRVAARGTVGRAAVRARGSERP
jgi:signal transduction histidine kinase